MGSESLREDQREGGCGPGLWPLPWRQLGALEEFPEQREETRSAKLTQDGKGQEWMQGGGPQVLGERRQPGSGCGL